MEFMQIFSRRSRAGKVPPDHGRSLHFASVSALLLIVLVLGGVVSYIARSATQAASAGLLPFTCTISPLVARSALRGPADPKQPISLAFCLRPRNAAGLARYDQDI